MKTPALIHDESISSLITNIVSDSQTNNSCDFLNLKAIAVRPRMGLLDPLSKFLHGSVYEDFWLFD